MQTWKNGKKEQKNLKKDYGPIRYQTQMAYAVRAIVDSKAQELETGMSLTFACSGFSFSIPLRRSQGRSAPRRWWRRRSCTGWRTFSPVARRKMMKTESAEIIIYFIQQPHWMCFSTGGCVRVQASVRLCVRVCACVCVCAYLYVCV